MRWKPPKDNHIVYEALSAIADDRFKLTDENTAECTSTSRGKTYSIEYNPSANQIMSDDNMAYYREEISYPMVAMLIAKGEIEFNRDILPHLANIKWKDINKKNRNDYMQSVQEVLERLKKKGIDTKRIENEVAKIFDYVCSKDLGMLGGKKIPPNAY